MKARPAEPTDTGLSIPDRPIRGPEEWTTDAGEAAADASLGEILATLGRHWVLVVALPLLLLTVAAVYSLLQPRTYTTSGSFIPQTRSGGGAISGVAAQFGLSVPTGEPEQSPAFYAELLSSRRILSGTAESTYTIPVDGGTVSGTLMEVLQRLEDTPPERQADVIGWLSARVKARAERETGMIVFSVTAPDANLSAEIGYALIARVNEFNIERRQSRARAERVFVERRMADMRAELAEAESQLEAFLARHRQFQNAPQLAFEYSRLQRLVSARQQIVTSLAEAYEQARIDEIRDIPVITVVDEPVTPVRPDGRGTIRRSVLGSIVGLIAAILLAFGIEAVRRSTGIGREVTNHS